MKSAKTCRFSASYHHPAAAIQACCPHIPFPRGQQFAQLSTPAAAHTLQGSVTNSTLIEQLSTLWTQYVYNSNTSQAEKLSRKGSPTHYFTQLIKKMSCQHWDPATELPSLTKVQADF